MKNFLFLFTLLSLQTFSQQVPSVQGRWVKGMKGSVNNISSAELKQEQLVVASIHKMISSRYKPDGVDATYSENHGYDKALNEKYFANPYAYGVYIVKPRAGESSTSFFVYANSMEWVNYLRCNYAPGQYPYLMMRAIPETRDGYVFYNLNKDLDQKDTSYTAYLITYPGKMPYRKVSRKEYLNFIRTEFIQEKQKKINDPSIPVYYPIRPAAEQQAAKQKTMDDIRAGKWGSNPEARLKRYLAEYKTDEELREEGIAKSVAYVQESIDRIDRLLNSSADELLLPAEVSTQGVKQQFKGFAQDNEGWRVIKLDSSYFNLTLPRSVPQFFTVFFKADKDALYEKNMRDIKSIIDIEMFRGMLGKSPDNSAITSAKPPAQKTADPTKGVKSGQDQKDVLANQPTKGFVQTPLAEIRQVVQVPVADPKKLKAVMAINLTSSNLKDYAIALVRDIEKHMNAVQGNNTSKISAACKTPTELADAGVMLYYKNAFEESLWCLSKAAVMQPDDDNIQSNLAAILNLCGAESRAIPILRYLKSRHPGNTTVLNNLGQAYYGMGDLQNSKTILDSCLRIYSLHPQANYTRCLIADKEGKSGESVKFLEKSIQGSFNSDKEDLAGKKNIKLDYAKLLNRHHPLRPDYFNPLKYLPPAQCKNLESVPTSEAAWKAWANAMMQVKNKINANIAAIGSAREKDYQRDNQILASKILPPLNRKAQLLYYNVYSEKPGVITKEAIDYYNHQYTEKKLEIYNKRKKRIEEIEKKYAPRFGEGKENPFEERCKEVNAASNHYLEEMANLNDDFNNRFAQPSRMLQSELMYWSLLSDGSANRKLQKYYQHAALACNPFQMSSAFDMPCGEIPEKKYDTMALEAPSAYCPINLRFKISIAKITGDCEKFDIELEVEGAVFNYERNFKEKTSAIAIGVGAGIEIESKTNSVIEDIGQIAEVTGAGVGAKGQVYIEFDKNGSVSDMGIKGEVGLEGPLSEAGDLKIIGKMSVVTGSAEIKATPAVIAIGQAISNVSK